MKTKYVVAYALLSSSFAVAGEVGTGRDNDTPDAAPPGSGAETASQASGLFDAWEMIEQWFTVDGE